MAEADEEVRDAENAYKTVDGTDAGAAGQPADAVESEPVDAAGSDAADAAKEDAAPRWSGDGRIDELQIDIVNGWYFDPEQPDVRHELEVIVDDEVAGTTVADHFRGDLLRNGKGDGAHGFFFKIPDRFFDGREHDVYVRVAATGDVLRRSLQGVVLSPELLPKVRGGLLSIDGGLVTGYSYDEGDLQRTVSVDVLVNGAVLATLHPTHDLMVGDTLAKGFSIPYSALFGPNALQDEIAFVFAGTSEALENPFGHLASSNVVIEVTGNDGRRISGQVWVPGNADDGVELELCVNEEPVSLLFRPAQHDGFSSFAFAVSVDPARKLREASLSVRLGGTDKVLGEPVSVSLARKENLLSDPLFAAWGARRPSAWALPDEVRKLAMPGLSSAGQGAVPREQAGAGGRTMILHFGTDAAAGGTILTQEFDISGLGPDATRVDVLTMLKATAPAGMRIALALEDEDGRRHEVSGELGVWPSWSRSAVRLILPGPSASFKSQATLSLSVAGPAPEFLHFAMVMLGLAGFQPSAAGSQVLETLAERPAEPVNAVINPDFTRWHAPLSQTLATRRIDCGDNWVVLSKSVIREFTVALDRVTLRDPAQATTARPAYAVELKGPIKSGYVRLDGELDVARLALQPLAELSFFAMADEVGSTISKVFIIRRRIADDDAGDAPSYSDDLFANVARRIHPTKAGRFFSFPFDPDKAAELHEEAKACIGDLQTKFLLAFEFDTAADCRLTSVYFGPLRARPSDAGSEDHLQFEDPRITGQLGKLKLLDAWAAPSRALPANGSRIRPTAAETRWRRPARDFPSVDVVICVYNALDDVLACLESIVASTLVPYTLTIIDDASAPIVGEALAAFAAGKPWVRVKTNPQNLGYTRSANIGLAGTDADWVILLNSDTIVTPGWIEGMMACAQSDPAIRFVGPVSNAASWQSVPEVKDGAGKWKVNRLPEGTTAADMAAQVRRVSKREYPRVPLLNGFCTLMEFKALEEIGFLDEAAFPMGYGEENDMCLRAGKAGYQLAIADDVYVYHSKSASFGTSRRAELSKRGNKALAEKHPDVIIRDIELELASVASVNGLREGLRTVAKEKAAEPAPEAEQAAELKPRARRQKAGAGR